MSVALTQITLARQALAKARTLDDVLNIRDKAEAVRVYAKAANEGLAAQNYAAEIKLLAERKAGALLATMQKHDGDPRSHDVTRLEDLGVSKMQSSRWQKEAAVSDAVFAELVKECNSKGQELTQTALLKRAGVAHVSQNSGETEWYTPAVIIEPARQVMGGIDLDPASTAVANRTVQASQFYTTDDNGLTQSWSGRVWLNPPYGQPLIAQFAERLSSSVQSGDVRQACCLVNNASETQWFRTLAGSASARCDIAGRVKFLAEDGEPRNTPLQGQAVLYFGSRTAEFVAAFESLGHCWFPARRAARQAD